MKNPLKIILAFLVVGVLIFGAYTFGRRNITGPSPITGQMVWEAVNTYRTQNGQSALPIEERACDNLVERFLAISNPGAGHLGYEEWVKKEGLEDYYAAIAELYVTKINAPENSIEFWSSSPGHNATLLGDYFTGGCAYAGRNDETNLNAAVVILVKKK